MEAFFSKAPFPQLHGLSRDHCYQNMNYARNVKDFPKLNIDDSVRFQEGDRSSRKVKILKLGANPQSCVLTDKIPKSK